MAAEIEEHIAENYDAIVADENRNVSYEQIAEHAENMDDKTLAAWARERAAAKGENVTPDDAEPAKKSKRAAKADEAV